MLIVTNVLFLLLFTGIDVTKATLVQDHEAAEEVLHSQEKKVGQLRFTDHIAEGDDSERGKVSRLDNAQIDLNLIQENTDGVNVNPDKPKVSSSEAEEAGDVVEDHTSAPGEGPDDAGDGGESTVTTGDQPSAENPMSAEEDLAVPSTTQAAPASDDTDSNTDASAATPGEVAPSEANSSSEQEPAGHIPVQEKPTAGSEGTSDDKTEDKEIVKIPGSPGDPIIAEPEEPTPPEPSGVDLSVHDMPVFEDWKKEYLENGEVKIVPSKVYQAQPTTEKKVLGASTTPPDKMRNYASAECGAKVISCTKDAKNPQMVLNENKDEYMMQPCSARKWLVIELCEPVLLHRIDIGNLELFSSTFENFTVYISKATEGGGKERPGKDWHSIGSFQAKEERVIQSANMTRPDLYTSFIKIEITSHYGNEHFCPVTIIRVYGSSLDDDDDDDILDSAHREEPLNQPELIQEVEMPCTQAPPSDSNSKDACSRGGSEPIRKGVVFPPQPAECFLCYDSLDLAPGYCWPEYYELRDFHRDSLNTSDECDTVTDNTTVKQPQPEEQENNLNKGASGGDPPADPLESKPCDPDSAPPSFTAKQAPHSAAASKTDMTATAKSIDPQAKKSDNKTSVNDSDVTKNAKTSEGASVKVKVEPSPEAVDSDGVGSSFVMVSSTTASPSYTADISSPTETATINQSAESSHTVDMPQSAEPELILPSPPTLAEPPTVAPEHEPAEAAQLPVTQIVAEEEPSLEETDGESAGSADHPLPAARFGSKKTAISKLSNQVRTLEHSLQVTNRYLDEMSKKYKNQKEDLQRALNHTMRSLQNTTMKLDFMRKEYALLKDTTQRLSEQLIELQEHLQVNQSTGWLTPAVTIGILLLAVLVSSCRRPQSEGISREEIAQILEDMPDSPVRRGHKRSGSTSEIISHGVEPPDPQLMKKAKSCATFNSISAGDVGGAETGREMGGVSEYQKASSDTAGAPDTSSTPTLASTQPEIPDDIEIICPATWRSFDTPLQRVLHIKSGDWRHPRSSIDLGSGSWSESDAKLRAAKMKKKRRSTKVKSSKNLLNGPIAEQAIGDLQHNGQSASSSQAHSSATSQSATRSPITKALNSPASSAANDTRYKNGARQNNITYSHTNVEPNYSNVSVQPQKSSSESSWISGLFRRRSAT